MKTSLKTLLAAALLGVSAFSMLGLAQDETKPAPPPEGPRGPGGPGGPGGQGGRRGMPTPEQQVTRLDEAVTLTADQKTKITEIYKKAAADMQAVPQEERREKMPAMMKATRDSIRALLTPEQQTKFDAMPQRGPGGRGPGGGGGGGPGGNRPPQGGGDAPKKE